MNLDELLNKQIAADHRWKQAIEIAYPTSHHTSLFYPGAFILIPSFDRISLVVFIEQLRAMDRRGETVFAGYADELQDRLDWVNNQALKGSARIYCKTEDTPGTDRFMGYAMSVNYVWHIDFTDKSDAMLFKLTWGGKA